MKRPQIKVACLCVYETLLPTQEINCKYKYKSRILFFPSVCVWAPVVHVFVDILVSKS